MGLLLTPLAVGAAFYVIPRVTSTPLYSHTLSLIGFWTLVAFYTHIGGHHILQAPIPNWLKAVSVVDSMAMVIPVFTVLANLWLTARGRGGALLRHPAGRFVLAGTIWYLLTCIQGPLQSLPGPAEGDALQQLDHRPLPHRRAGLRRLHRPGRPVARAASVDEAQGLFAASWSSSSSGWSPSA